MFQTLIGTVKGTSSWTSSRPRGSFQTLIGTVKGVLAELNIVRGVCIEFQTLIGTVKGSTGGKGKGEGGA